MSKFKSSIYIGCLLNADFFLLVTGTNLNSINAATHSLACHWRADFFNCEKSQPFFIAVDRFRFNRLSYGHAAIGCVVQPFKSIDPITGALLGEKEVIEG